MYIFWKLSHFSKEMFNFLWQSLALLPPGADQPKEPPVEHLLHCLGSRAGVILNVLQLHHFSMSMMSAKAASLTGILRGHCDAGQRPHGQWHRGTLPDSVRILLII